MRKIFYKEITEKRLVQNIDKNGNPYSSEEVLPTGQYKIMGMSSGEDSMDFPYVETDIDYHSTSALGIEMIDGVITLVVIQGTLQ